MGKEEVKDNSEAIIKPSSPLVFISHDTRDAGLAEAFSKLLSSVSMGVLKSFRSSDKKGSQGIEFGVEWYPEIMKRLDEASDVVCLLTPNSLDRPWILFEAGVAKGKLGTPLLGIALGIPLGKANNGPFAQFQNCADDEIALTKLVTQLVKKIPNAEPDEEIIKGQVTVFKTKVEKIFEEAKKQIQVPENKSDDKDDATTAKIFEEIKVMFHDLPSRIDNRLRHDARRQMLRMHPKMVRELMDFAPASTSARFLVLISLFKNDIPWIYEIGLEVFHEIRGKRNSKESMRVFQEFDMILEYTLRNPYLREWENNYYEEQIFMLKKFLDRIRNEKEFSTEIINS